MSNDSNSPDSSLQFGVGYPGLDLYNGRIPSYSYLDLEAAWSLGKVVTLRAGLNNILDKDPPVVDSFIVGPGAANTYSFYDMFGRQLFVAFTARF